MFFWTSLAVSMTHWMLEIWSVVPLPFLNSVWTSRSSWFTYYWSPAWITLSIYLLACEMSAIVWKVDHSLALPFFGIGMKIELFQSYGYCWVFQICWHNEFNTFTSSSFRIWSSSTGISSPQVLRRIDKYKPFPVLLIKFHI